MRFLAPVMPAKVIGIGLNYRDHAEESGLGLIAGRPPQVSVAPAGATVPEGWRSPGDFH